MTRRLNSYNNPEWTPWLMVAACGALIIACGIFLNIVQIVWSIIKRKENPDLTGDPWDGRTLEWATSSPAPFYNFAHLPKVNGLDQHWRDKEAGTAYQRPTHFEDIHMPRNTAIGVWMGAFSVLLGFGMIWHIWWMAIIGLVGMIGSFLVRAFDDDIDYYVPAAEVARIENARYDRLDRLRAAKTGAL
jgi:cytochrome o ubiquinol oxidase subunit 1